MELCVEPAKGQKELHTFTQTTNTQLHHLMKRIAHSCSMPFHKCAHIVDVNVQYLCVFGCSFFPPFGIFGFVFLLFRFCSFHCGHFADVIFVSVFRCCFAAFDLPPVKSRLFNICMCLHFWYNLNFCAEDFYKQWNTHNITEQQIQNKRKTGKNHTHRVRLRSDGQMLDFTYSFSLISFLHLFFSGSFSLYSENEIRHALAVVYKNSRVKRSPY